MPLDNVKDFGYDDRDEPGTGPGAEEILPRGEWLLLTEVVDAEVMLAKVKTAFLLAYYQYDVALINLLSVCGTPEQFHQYKMEGKTEELWELKLRIEIEN